MSQLAPQGLSQLYVHCAVISCESCRDKFHCSSPNKDGLILKCFEPLVSLTEGTIYGFGVKKILCMSMQVMLVIDAAVSHLDDLHTLEDFLSNLGRQHQAVGVKTQSFAVSTQ